jgi:outer membrane protein assembly factor BamB
MGTLVACIATVAPTRLPAPSALGRLLHRALGIVAVAMLVLAAGAGAAFAEVTGAADDLRTGWYPDEPSLTPALASGGSFQQAFKRRLQGQIYAQPLTANGTMVVATEDNWVYGLDPNSGATRWEKQFGTPVESTEKEIECTDLEPHIGITGTPVIDTEHNIVYFVSNQYISKRPGPIAWYMHAIALGSGEEAAHFPVKIDGEAQNLPGVKFLATRELQRPALLMMNGVVYAGFGSHCDHTPYEGWLAGVSTSGQLATLWASSPSGASIWQSGGGLISDGPGQILFSTGNGKGNPGSPPAGPGNKPPSTLGESVVRVAVQPEGGLKATDFFSPSNNVELDKQDLDLGSSAPVALPPQYFGTPSVPNLLVQAGKEGYVYLLNRDNLGGMDQGPSGTDKVVQRLGPYGGVWDGSAVWPGDGGYVYIPSVERLSDHLRFFKYGVAQKTGEPMLSLAATSPDSPTFGSGSPIVTSNGIANGTAILWTTWCSVEFASCKEAKLRAYNAVPSKGSPQLLWEAPIGQATKFSRPDASDGHVYVGNREGDIFAYSGHALTPSAESLDLGTAPLGSRPTGEVTFTNTGTKLKVSAVRPPSAPFEATGLPEVGAVIEPGQVITVKVAFQSPTPGSFARSLGVTTEAGDTSIALSASAGEPPPTLVTGAVSSPGQGALPFENAPAPDAELASRSLRVSPFGVVSVTVTCPTGESRCTGTITLRTLNPVAAGRGNRSKKRKLAVVTLAVGSFTVAGGNVTTVKLHLSAEGRALLARTHLLHVLATIVASDATGAAHTSQTTATIRRARSTLRR